MAYVEGEIPLGNNNNGNNSPYFMPVMPYGYGGMNGGFGGGFGGGWEGLIALAIFGMMFGGFGGGWGGMGGMYSMFPWLLFGQNNTDNNVNDGFRTAQLQDSVTSVRDGIGNLSTQLCDCCGDMQMAMANGFANTTAAITGAQNALAQQLYANEIASLNRSFAEQTANTAGFTGVNSNLCDIRYSIATEAAATRAATQAQMQTILDKLCDQELQAERRENQNLRAELLYARGQASQIDQTAQIRAGQNAAVNSLVNELRSCPIPAQPVYGSQPIFTCPNNNGCGCQGVQ